MQTILTPNPKQKEPITEVVEDLALGLSTIANKVSTVFSTVQPLYGCSVSKSEIKQLKTQIREYYGQTKVYPIDVKSIYDTIKDDLVQVLIAYVKPPDAVSFEEILKDAMELSRCANNPIIKGLDMLPSLDNLLDTDLIDADAFGIQRASLAIIWASLLVAIIAKYTTLTSTEKGKLVKAGISLSLGIGVAFIQFLHKSPESITNYLRMLYEGYNTVRDLHNKYFERQVPDILKMESPRLDFARMTKQDKITTGQVLNMVYTFRVGDMCLSLLEREKSSTISDDICKQIISSIVPFPRQDETNKIYRLYSSERLYNIH